MSADARKLELFFEVFTGLPRQGPGDDASTLEALARVPGTGAATRVLDIGCGTGRQTRVLARAGEATIIGIDNHPPFVEVANRLAREDGLADRVSFQVGDMSDLSFSDRSFDLLWCEGAIYIIGFEDGLRRWRRLLAPAGHLVVSEACWMRPDPPPECLAFWMSEYPAMRSVATLLDVVETGGWETLSHFTLPRTSWWTDYYEPLQRNVEAFRRRHPHDRDAQELADVVVREIEVWQRYAEFYSYEFLIMRPRGGAVGASPAQRGRSVLPPSRP